jgi:hypothetical protein
MTTPTETHGQITDAVTQCNTKVLGDAPPMAMGSIYQTMAHSRGPIFESVANKLPDTIYAHDVQQFCIAASETSSVDDIAQLLARLHAIDV